MVNFKRGSGKVYGRIVKKDVVEENPDWNGKVVLPVPTSTDLIANYDPFTKSLTYTKEETKKCELGCDLYIAVESDEKYQPEISDDLINEYSIYIRTTSGETYKRTVVDIPTNEYVFGAIEFPEADGYYEYFSFVMPYDADEIIVEFQSEICSFYMNLGEEKPTAEKFKWEHHSNGKDSLYVIKVDKTEIPETLVGKKFTIGISAKALDSLYTATYNFRIRAPVKDLPDIVQITSDQSALCEVKIVSSSTMLFVFSSIH